MILKAGLGLLDRLPLELKQQVLLHLDINTLTDFRHVNKRALQLVTSFPQFKVVLENARTTLHAIVATGVGRFINCQTLYEEFCTEECENCGGPGGYLYLLTCTRVCYECFTHERRYSPILYGDAIRMFGVSRRILAGLPKVLSIPGRYGVYNVIYCRRDPLIDPGHARNAGIARHGSVTAMEEYVSQISEERQDRILVRGLKRLDKCIRVIDPPSNGRHLDANSRTPLCFMVIVSMPWFNKTSQSIERRAHCKDCKDSDRTSSFSCRRESGVNPIDEHFTLCENVKDWKHRESNYRKIESDGDSDSDDENGSESGSEDDNEDDEGDEGELEDGDSDCESK